MKIFHDESGKPTHVMLRWDEYDALANPVDASRKASRLLYDNRTKVKMFSAISGNDIDIPMLVKYLKKLGIDTIVINASTKAFANFAVDEQMSLEYIVRTAFVGETSPYANTMACTPVVATALVQSGCFTRTKSTHTTYLPDWADRSQQTKVYSRRVNALKLVY
jgi:hypothetical protein